MSKNMALDVEIPVSALAEAVRDTAWTDVKGKSHDPLRWSRLGCLTNDFGL